MRWMLILFLLGYLFANAAQSEPLLAHMGISHETEEGWSVGHLHPMLVHFPIVLFIVAFVFDLLFLMGKIEQPAYLPSHWIVIAGALIAIPSVITGLYASTMSDIVGNPHIPIHKFWGFITLFYSALHAIFRGYILKTKSSYSPKLVALISMINVILIGITAEYGSTVTHGRGFFEHPVNTRSTSMAP